MDKIISYCDGLMVARGDLGRNSPGRGSSDSKELVKRQKDGFPSSLHPDDESMIDSLTATRAEVNDVANSVGWSRRRDALRRNFCWISRAGDPDHEFHHSQCGKLELISVPQNHQTSEPLGLLPNPFVITPYIANDVQAKAICTLTNSGYTAFRTAWRPNSHILLFTPNKNSNPTQSHLGVKPFSMTVLKALTKLEQINEIAKKSGYVDKGDLLVNLTAMPIIKKGMVNTLRVSTIWFLIVIICLLDGL